MTWTNDDGARHRMRTTSGPGEFDSGNLEPGESFSFTFDLEGTYLYMDDRDRDNSDYHGTIIVTAVTPGDPGDPPRPPPPAGDVRIINDTFQPGSITVNVGGTVTWSNQDREHTVTARDRSWDSGIFDAGQSFSQTFNSPGTFEYFCIIHPDMVGTVVVVGDGEEPAPPLPLPPPPTPTPPPLVPGVGDVAIVDNAFGPSPMTVTVGSRVRWVNTGILPHTVTAAGQFDSGILMAGDTWSRTFNSAGTFNYICTLHPEMTGTVIVTGSDGQASIADGGDAGDGTASTGDAIRAPGAAAGTPGINMIDNAYDPVDIEVQAGSSITWTNIGDVPHTVTARDQSYDSGFLMTGESWTMQFNEAGVYEYFCTIHPEMVGRVTVVATAETTGASSASETSAMAADGPQAAVATPSGQIESGTGTTRNVAALVGNAATLFLALVAAALVVFFVRDSRRQAGSEADAG